MDKHFLDAGFKIVKTGFSANACYQMQYGEKQYCEIDNHGFATLIRVSELKKVRNTKNVTLPLPIRCQESLTVLLKILRIKTL